MLFVTPAPVPPAGCWQLKVRRSGAEGQGSGLQVSPDVKVGFFAAGLVHGLTAEMVRKAGISLACGGELSSGHCMMQAWCWKQCIAMTALLHAQQLGAGYCWPSREGRLLGGAASDHQLRHRCPSQLWPCCCREAVKSLCQTLTPKALDLSLSCAPGIGLLLERRFSACVLATAEGRRLNAR